jgi:hypothetical protein
MDAILKAVASLKTRQGKAPACYRSHVNPPREGKVVVRFSLTPHGKAERFEVTRDDFGNAGLTSCLVQALAAVTYPAPGDVPCQVVHPFTFVPESPHGQTL